ncbi:MAG: hypothetical protein ACRD0P_14350 [Stackebrandtia sp.]
MQSGWWLAVGTVLILLGILSVENPEAMRVPVGLALALVGALLAYLAVRDIRRSRK